MNAVIYCRVSDLRGNKKRDDWDSIPRQRAALLDLAGRYGMAVVSVYEEAQSGAKERPVFERMMTQIRAGEADAILVATFDRLTRTERLGEFEQMKAELRRLDVKLFTADMGQVPLDGRADSELLTDMRASVAKFERLKIRERTLAAREAIAKAGKWTGHLAPYGYRTMFDPVTGARTFEVDADQAEVVRQVFEMYLGGEGPKDIALWLQAAGHRPPRSDTWSKQFIRYILKNPIYAGVSVFRKPYNRPNDTKSGPIISAVSTAFPPIVSLDTFERAQEEKASRQVVRRNGPGTPHPLSGILRCNSCDGKMGFYQMGTGRYKCQTNDSYPGRCPQPMGFNAEQCHGVVLRFLKRELPRYLDERHLAQVQADEHGAKAPDELGPLRAKLNEAERAREALIRKIALEELAQEDVEFTLRSLRQEVAELKEKVSRAERAQTAALPGRLTALGEVCALLDEYSASDDDQELRELFEAVLMQVYLIRTGKNPGDRRKWLLDVDHAMLLNGDDIRRG